MEYYSAIKNEEILPFVTTWMDLEGMLSEISQTEKDKYYMMSLICGMCKKKKKKSIPLPLLQTYTKLIEKDQISGYQNVQTSIIR